MVLKTVSFNHTYVIHAVTSKSEKKNTLFSRWCAAGDVHFRGVVFGELRLSKQTTDKQNNKQNIWHTLEKVGVATMCVPGFAQPWHDGILRNLMTCLIYLLLYYLRTSQQIRRYSTEREEVTRCYVV
jgi:hypothetical protein